MTVADLETEKRKRQPWRTLEARAIFAPLPPLAYVIRGLDLCPGAPAMIAGYGYSGKTLAAQAAEIAIAGGLGKVWGSLDCVTVRTLHVDYEQGERLTRERFQRLAMPHMLAPDDFEGRLSLISMPGIYLDQPGVESNVEKLVDGAQLVVIDSLRAACPSLDENASSVRAPLDMLTRVSERTGTAFVVIHHSRKPTVTQAGGSKMAIRGSGALFDACGSVLIFEGEKGQPVRVSHEKARASGVLTPDFELDISDVPDGENLRGGLLVTARGALSKQDAAEEAEKARRLARTGQVMGELRSLFERERVLGGADAIATKLGRETHVVRGALTLLVESGEVERVGSTRDRKHRWVGT